MSTAADPRDQGLPSAPETRYKGPGKRTSRPPGRRYFDYLQTLLHRALGPGFYPRGLAIQFNREIDVRTSTLTAGLKPAGGTILFKLFDEDAVFAAGGVQPDAPPLPLQPR